MPAPGSGIYTEAVIPAPHAPWKVIPIDWYRFLKRPQLPSPAMQSLPQLHGSSILVTGAGGSIGSALSLQLSKLQPRQLTLLDASEQALYRLQAVLAGAALRIKPSIVLANIAGSAHLEEIFENHRPHLIFHAAAYKHLPLLEEHPLEAIANNALGTLNLVQCAKKHNIARIVLLSTDKAVAPTSILGASKRIAEQITLAHGGVVLRLGNILGSEGSVSETFLRQIAAGGPVTLTDRGAERYFLTCEEAVDLLLASTAVHPGNLLVPNLNRQYSIVSLAEFLLSTYAPHSRPTIVFTGLRPGDKIREALWSSDERPLFPPERGYLKIEQRTSDPLLLHRELSRLADAVQERNLLDTVETVLRLVPSYTPSATVLALMQQSALGASHR
jgi:FlaA1/EpsC-like NDP-sugar epimerase